jgi:DNA (cytosine-5)-methyltransferase 1
MQPPPSKHSMSSQIGGAMIAARGRAGSAEAGKRHGSAYKVVSLFSGAGGLDLGFRLAGGFHTVLANEVVQPAVETFHKNFGLPIRSVKSAAGCSAVYLGSIEDLDFGSLQLDAEVDVLIGGPPCQDFSIVRGPAWDRKGIEVKRGRLYSHFIRALVAVRPKIFVFENVPGLTSANDGQAYEEILKDFSNLEYRWEEIKSVVGNGRDASGAAYSLVFRDVVDASKLGVPQSRRRLIIIGVRKDQVRAQESAAGKLAASMLSGQAKQVNYCPLTPLEVFEGRPLPDLAPQYALLMKEYGLLVRHGRKRRSSFNIVADYLRANAIGEDAKLDKAFEEHEALLSEVAYLGQRISSVRPADGSNEITKEDPAVLARMRRIPPGKNHEAVRGTKWEVEGRGISLIYRRLHPLKPAYTVVAFGGGGTWGYHYERSRSKLTNRERARLQTFPDAFLFEGTGPQVRGQIGEAVPPLLAKKIAEVCKAILVETCRAEPPRQLAISGIL